MRRRECLGPAWPILLATWLAALLVVGWMAFALREGAHWALDPTITRALQSQRGPILDAVMVGVSYLGFAFPFVPIVILVSLALWFWRSRAEALFVSLGTGAAYAVGFGIKELVRRPRPAGAEILVYQRLSDFSFPSEHVATYTVFFGALCYLAVARWQGKPYRWPALVLGALLILLVGPSRIYLGAHWPSDVLAGYLLGYSILLASICLFRWWTVPPDA